MAFSTRRRYIVAPTRNPQALRTSGSTPIVKIPNITVSLMQPACFGFQFKDTSKYGGGNCSRNSKSFLFFLKSEENFRNSIFTIKPVWGSHESEMGFQNRTPRMGAS